ncbi:hypothetical protein K469DRAFT_731332 [Zopfia rhizophila CBS 207.26]|uniref:Uncharacterized protein n=1 Tax=Zopfia rhizophila CBS 207.26 TaxID=1314779 RepID=A0A6A6DHW5_9PEZI|nr:hypothetical protein K469DRAFT_731332 [Zopfia rhizophila CBS 207.26]
MAASGSGEPDMVLVGELFEEISRHPPAIQARKLLVEHYISTGWLDAAQDNAKELKRLVPKDSDVKGYLTILAKKPEPPAPTAEAASAGSSTSTPTPTPAPVKRKSVQPPVQLPTNLESAKQDLSQGYKNLRVKAKSLLTDLLHLQALQKKNGLPTPKNITKVEAIAEGRNANTVVKAHAPGSARSVARLIQAEPEKSIDLSINDLEDMMKWLRAPHGKPSGMDNDAVREALVKRVRALESALPDDLKILPDVALMHIEHEYLEKTYVNDETMLGDPAKEIPRKNFLVTEDNYAWDMEELTQAITSNGGVMRNPLSRQMFTPRDIRGIVLHPQGKQLAALQIEQHEMSKGVRPDTIEHLENLGKILLEDQSSDQLPSRHAIDGFMAYCATLPEVEQKALDGLKCPAKDSHTGQSYDFTIGEAVRDAKGNRVCFHKTGDFIKQAAAYLRQNRGAPPDPNKCGVM